VGVFHLNELENKPKVLDVDKIVKSAKVVGNVFARYTYGINKIFITLRKNIRLPLGAYVFVLDDEGLPIVYQVASPEYYRYGHDFEKRLIAHGGISSNGSHTYDCTGILVGKVCEDGRIEPPKYPIVPLSNVYSCPEDLVRIIIEPSAKFKVVLGKNPNTGLPVSIALRPLIRQGLLISGAQGTGKTTALLTLICRSLEAYDGLHFLILDWTGEFSPLKNSKFIQNNNIKVHTIFWDTLLLSLAPKNPSLLMKLIKEDDPRVTGATEKVLEGAVVICGKRGMYPTKKTLLEIVGRVETVTEAGRSKRGVVGGYFTTRSPSTIETVRNVIETSRWIVEKEVPEETLNLKQFKNLITSNNIVVVDFSTTKREQVPDDFEIKKDVATVIAGFVWDEARRDKNFGCIVVSDEAHRIAPERDFGYVNQTWIRLATEGGRNGTPLWLVARRLSLVSKSVTTELQQNFFCFNVEDVDRRRIIEDLGETFATLLGSLPPGEAVAKSAVGFKIPGQVIHVKFDKVIEPSSVKYGLEERFRRYHLA